MNNIDRSMIMVMLAAILSKLNDGFVAGLWFGMSIFWLVIFTLELVQRHTRRGEVR